MDAPEPMSEERRQEIEQGIQRAFRSEGWWSAVASDLLAEVDRLRSLKVPTRQQIVDVIHSAWYNAPVSDCWGAAADAVLALFSQPPDPECNGLCVFGDGEDAGPDPTCPLHGPAAAPPELPEPPRPEWVRFTERFGQYQKGTVCRTIEPGPEDDAAIGARWVLVDGEPGGFSEPQWTPPDYIEPTDPPAADPEPERPQRIRLTRSAEGYERGDEITPLTWNAMTGRPVARSRWTAHGSWQVPDGAWEPAVPPVAPETGVRDALEDPGCTTEATLCGGAGPADCWNHTAVDGRCVRLAATEATVRRALGYEAAVAAPESPTVMVELPREVAERMATERRSYRPDDLNAVSFACRREALGGTHDG